MTILFDEIVFGPVKSRRFGVSLGMNLLPVDFKYCTFNCIYCECGWTYKKNSEKIKLPSRAEVFDALDIRLKSLKEKEIVPDHITFAGNGEPTIHPEFSGIVDDTILLRDRYFPETQITVLSNASLIHKPKVFEALNKVDNNVLKLDSAIDETFRLINQPAPTLKLTTIIENMKRFEGNQIVQTLFIRGKFDGKVVDNTTDREVNAWLDVIREIHPKSVMIYPIERETAAEGLVKVPASDLESIAVRVKKAGIPVKVYS